MPDSILTASALYSSLFLLTRTNPEPDSPFGSSFVILRDEFHIYLLTCWHVLNSIREGGYEVLANGMPTELVAEDEKADLAVVRIEFNFRWMLADPLLLLNTDSIGQQITIAGWSEFGGNLKLEPLNGTLGPEISLALNQRPFSSIPSKRIDISNASRILPGYSGSPVIDLNTGCVVGVLRLSEDPGFIGTAISLTSLNTIWPEMPSSLIRPIPPSSRKSVSMDPYDAFKLIDLVSKQVKKIFIPENFAFDDLPTTVVNDLRIKLNADVDSVVRSRLGIVGGLIEVLLLIGQQQIQGVEFQALLAGLNELKPITAAATWNEIFVLAQIGTKSPNEVASGVEYERKLRQAFVKATGKNQSDVPSRLSEMLEILADLQPDMDDLIPLVMLIDELTPVINDADRLLWTLTGEKIWNESERTYDKARRKKETPALQGDKAIIVHIQLDPQSALCDTEFFNISIYKAVKVENSAKFKSIAQGSCTFNKIEGVEALKAVAVAELSTLVFDDPDSGTQQEIVFLLPEELLHEPVEKWPVKSDRSGVKVKPLGLFQPVFVRPSTNTRKGRYDNFLNQRHQIIANHSSNNPLNWRIHPSDSTPTETEENFREAIQISQSNDYVYLILAHHQTQVFLYSISMGIPVIVWIRELCDGLSDLDLINIVDPKLLPLSVYTWRKENYKKFKTIGEVTLLYDDPAYSLQNQFV